MTLDELIGKLSEIAPPSDDLPTLCDLGIAVREFFSRPDIQEWMIETNQSNLYDKQENVYGQHLGIYTDKTAKHKRKYGMPDHYYTYKETGKTYDSLEVVVLDDGVGIYPSIDAPDYANLALDTSAWGLQPDDLDERMEEITIAVVEQIRDFING